MNGDQCHAHSGICKTVKTLEANVTELWKNWNGMQKILIGIFVGVIMNLIGVIVVYLHAPK